jgi:CRP-like cAMP-binding protein
LGKRLWNERNGTAAAVDLAAGADSTIRNEILLALPHKEYNLVFQRLEFVQMPTPFLLQEALEPIPFAYFINGGLASILVILADGKSIEVGLTGKEGFVGIPLLVGMKQSPTRIVMQVSGSGFRIKPNDLMELLGVCPTLKNSLLRYSQELAIQTSQVAACNRVHEVDQRLARWLLMSQDRLGGDIVPLTQEFLAHMLGTRRASVTVAASRLQAAGLIHYKRGRVQVVDREKLEAACCECYSAMVRHLHNSTLAS